MRCRRLYLDVCCLNRPTDDLSIDRNRLEAEAVLAIIAHARNGEWDIVSSTVIEYEVQQCPDLLRQQVAAKLASAASVSLTIERQHYNRAEELVRIGFGQFDALHIASAESADCDVLLSTDDRLLKRAARNAKALKVRVANPLAWLLEQNDAHNTNDSR